MKQSWPFAKNEAGQGDLVWHEHDSTDDFFLVIEPFERLAAADLDGILMANSLHYVENQAAFIRRCESHMKARRRFLIVEYDTSEPSRWIPHPLSQTRLKTLFERVGYPSVRVLRSRASIYRRAPLYAAAIGLL